LSLVCAFITKIETIEPKEPVQANDMGHSVGSKKRKTASMRQNDVFDSFREQSFNNAPIRKIKVSTDISMLEESSHNR